MLTLVGGVISGIQRERERERLTRRQNEERQSEERQNEERWGHKIGERSKIFEEQWLGSSKEFLDAQIEMYLVI